MKYLRILLIALLVLGLASVASASISINDPANGEQHLYQIYMSAVGGNFSGSNDLTFAALQVSPTWSTGDWKIVETFKYAGNSQSLGYDNGSGFVPLINNVPNTNPSPSGLISPITGSFAWEDRTNGNTWSSDNSKNVSSEDHFVAFSTPNTSEYLIAFEDLPFYNTNGSILSDRDYNDLVVLVEKVPEPTMFLLFGAGLLGLGLMRKRFEK